MKRTDRMGVAFLAATIAVMVALNIHWAGAGNQEVRRYPLFMGISAADSSEQASPWIPIRGASRVYIRTLSNGAIADTDFCDTITTWKTLLSDSVLFMARDSLGTIVTARSTQTNALAFPMCGDSIVITNNAADSTKMVGVYGAVSGVAKLIRASVSGSGLYTVVYPTPLPGVVSSQLSNTNDRFMVGYMRIRYTPRTRLTTAGFSSTQGIRTRGINKLRCEALVVYENK